MEDAGTLLCHYEVLRMLTFHMLSLSLLRYLIPFYPILHTSQALTT